MNNKVYVGNLSWGTSTDTLFRVFGPFGEIEEARWLRWDANRKNGLGLVVYRTEEPIEKVINEMDGAQLDGKHIIVGTVQEDVLKGKRERWN